MQSAVNLSSLVMVGAQPVEAPQLQSSRGHAATADFTRSWPSRRNRPQTGTLPEKPVPQRFET